MQHLYVGLTRIPRVYSIVSNSKCPHLGLSTDVRTTCTHKCLVEIDHVMTTIRSSVPSPHKTRLIVHLVAICKVYVEWFFSYGR